MIPRGTHRIPASTLTDLECGKGTTAKFPADSTEGEIERFPGGQVKNGVTGIWNKYFLSRVRFWMGLDYICRCQMRKALHRITGTVAGAMMLTLSSCSLGVKVREDWSSLRRQPIPLGEASRTWAEMQHGGTPAPGDLDRYNEAVRSSLVQVADN